MPELSKNFEKRGNNKNFPIYFDHDCNCSTTYFQKDQFLFDLDRFKLENGIVVSNLFFSKRKTKLGKLSINKVLSVLFVDYYADHADLYYSHIFVMFRSHSNPKNRFTHGLDLSHISKSLFIFMKLKNLAKLDLRFFTSENYYNEHME